MQCDSGEETMALDIRSWRGRIDRSTSVPPRPLLVLPQQRSRVGGSGTFLAADSESRQWWVKPLNNRQGSRVLVTEQVVGRAGALIGAPVCEVAIVEIPEELAGWQFLPDRRLEAGLAHGSAAVDQAIEERSLGHSDRDDNRIRQAGVFALYDWCWGDDPQWLFSATRDMELYSHDHGHYLPRTELEWTVEGLESHADIPRQAPWPTEHLDRSELCRLASALREVDRDQLGTILAQIPEDWPISTEELEALGWFLEYRAGQVAHRLDAI